MKCLKGVETTIPKEYRHCVDTSLGRITRHCRERVFVRLHFKVRKTCLILQKHWTGSQCQHCSADVIMRRLLFFREKGGRVSIFSKSVMQKKIHSNNRKILTLKEKKQKK